MSGLFLIREAGFTNLILIFPLLKTDDMMLRAFWTILIISGRKTIKGRILIVNDTPTAIDMAGCLDNEGISGFCGNQRVVWLAFYRISHRDNRPNMGFENSGSRR